MFKRISMCPAILKMSDGDFMVGKEPAGSSRAFRLNPFMTDQDFFDMMVPKFEPTARLGLDAGR